MCFDNLTFRHVFHLHSALLILPPTEDYPTHSHSAKQDLFSITDENTDAHRK